MPNQRNEAEALAACLELDLADVPDAVRWADEQILASDVPHNALCDVAMAARSNNWDVAGMLRQLPGTIDQSFVVRRLIECATERLRSDNANARTVAFALYQLAMDETLPPGPLRKDAWWFYDAIDLATSGYIQETPDEVIRQMLNALDTELEAMNGDEQIYSKPCCRVRKRHREPGIAPQPATVLCLMVDPSRGRGEFNRYVQNLPQRRFTN